MEHEQKRREAELEEQLADPWEWSRSPYRILDGWQINKNRPRKDKYLQELGKDFGPITIPHRQR